MDHDAYSKIPMWQHREALRGAKFSYFFAGAVLGALAYHLWLQW